MVYKVLNINIFLTQMHHLTLEGLYYPPVAVRSTFYDGWMRFFGLQNHVQNSLPL